MEKRDFKDKVYTHLAQLIKAMANSHRLEIIDLLGQGPRTVEEIARETSMSVANASQHLQVLKGSNLVEIKRAGNYIQYRLADEKIYRSWQNLREMGIERVAEINKLVRDFRLQKHTLEVVRLDELTKKLKEGNIILLDVRPEQEYRAGHLPNALSVPIDLLQSKLKELPREKELVAYCRGPFCVYADEAVELLTASGFNAKRLEEGFPDWKLKGLPVEITAN